MFRGELYIQNSSEANLKLLKIINNIFYSKALETPLQPNTLSKSQNPNLFINEAFTE